MQKFQYTALDRILAKFYRDYKGIDIDEADAIEWIGEALDFMKIASVSEEVVEFLRVENNVVPIPRGLQYIIQIGSFRRFSELVEEDCEPKVFIEQLNSEPTTVTMSCPEQQGSQVDCNNNPTQPENLTYIRPLSSLKYSYGNWRGSSLQRNFEPVRLANNSFFNSLVCKLKDQQKAYIGCRLEYTIVQDYLKFSFQKGLVAVAYLRTKVDDCTGYPMVPDDAYAIAAITYYILWKFKEREKYLHREGSFRLADDAKEKWEEYIGKFKAKAKMPQTLDDYQDLLEEQYYMLPDMDKYYQFFGNLGTKEMSTYSDPDRRNYYGR